MHGRTLPWYGASVHTVTQSEVYGIAGSGDESMQRVFLADFQNWLQNGSKRGGRGCQVVELARGIEPPTCGLQNRNGIKSPL